ncbi:MAG TPA: acyl-CoA synthetase, partial [Oceanospirillaceae bacterium]|nr:acyl-CoA synthetase [Oceanospirillaceae bacterium]
VPPGDLANSLEEAIAVADNIGYPVTIKAVSDQLTHKTEQHGVYLKITTQQELEAAVQQLQKLADQVLVERMETGVIAELILGVNHDPLFGNYLVVGAGGILVELLKDSQLLLLPCTPEDVHTALGKLAIQPLLTGYRGQEAADLNTIVEAIVAVQDYIKNHPVKELDINPLLVKAHSCIAVDALISQ